MATIYISSTYADLKDCRKAVFKTLSKMKHDVIAMEDYVASDKRPLDQVREHVANCDLYIGLFAWRCGFVPEKGNPEKLSIAELEYLRARASGKPCLIFILDRDAPWPATAIRRKLRRKSLNGSFRFAQTTPRLYGTALCPSCLFHS